MDNTRNKSLKRRFYIGALSVLNIIAIILLIAVLIDTAYQDRVAPNVIIAGIDVSKLPADHALEIIQQRKASIAEKKLTIQFEENAIEIAAKDLIKNIDDQDARRQLLSSTAGAWRFAKLNFWREFFSQKVYGYVIEPDTEAINELLIKHFSVSDRPINAQLLITDSGLTVVESKDGHAFDISKIENTLISLGNQDSNLDIKIAAIISPPAITTDKAFAIKQTIETSFKQIVLSSEDKAYTITSTDQINWLDIIPEKDTFRWQINQGKVHQYLTKKIIPQFSVAMVQRSIRAENGEVVNAGREGKQVELNALMSLVLAQVSRQDSNAINVPLVTVGVTDKVIYPNFVAGLYEGLYLDINISKQRLYVLQGSELIKEYTISSGKSSTPTPLGVMYVRNKHPFARSSRFPGIYMIWWNGLTFNSNLTGGGVYGIHGLPCFDPNCQIIEGAPNLGRAVSAGCIRLSWTDAEWIYGNVPVGTPVNIHI